MEHTTLLLKVHLRLLWNAVPPEERDRLYNTIVQVRRDHARLSPQAFREKYRGLLPPDQATAARLLWDDLGVALRRLVVDITPEMASAAVEAWEQAALAAARARSEAVLQGSIGTASMLDAARARARLGRALGGMAKQWAQRTEEGAVHDH